MTSTPSPCLTLAYPSAAYAPPSSLARTPRTSARITGKGNERELTIADPFERRVILDVVQKLIEPRRVSRGKESRRGKEDAHLEVKVAGTAKDVFDAELFPSGGDVFAEGDLIGVGHCWIGWERGKRRGGEWKEEYIDADG